jgi:hypothetical protein
MDRRIVGFQERLDKEREDLSNSDQIGYICAASKLRSRYLSQ